MEPLSESKKTLSESKIQTSFKRKTKSKHKLKMKSLNALQLTPLFDSSPSSSASAITELSPLPCPVLTRQNSKKWEMLDFDNYEMELKEGIDALLESNKTSDTFNNYTVKATSKTRKRRHSSLSFQNEHEWSDHEMNEYEDELVKQFQLLANQIKLMSETSFIN